MPDEDRNDLGWWFPRLQALGTLQMPETEIVRTDVELFSLLDGKEPSGWGDFMHELTTAVELIGAPCFLRTGHTSGKHSWRECCYVEDATEEAVGWHVVSLVEQSANADLFGLPTETWAVRRLVETAPLFELPMYGGFPVTREFRLFVTGDGEVEHLQPYWPAGAVEQGGPEDPGWRERLAEASRITLGERAALASLASTAQRALGGAWSVDFLQDAAGGWWLTDCAEAERSFRYDPEDDGVRA